jgi:hypothetical protein
MVIRAIPVTGGACLTRLGLRRAPRPAGRLPGGRCGACGLASSVLWVAMRTASPSSSMSCRNSRCTSSAVFGIEVAGRLVGQQQHRLVGQRPGDGDALLLAARQLRRPMLEALAKPQPLQQRSASPRLRVLARRPGDELGNGDVLHCGELRQQMVELVDEADAETPDAGAGDIVAARCSCARPRTPLRRSAPRAARRYAAATTCPRPTARPAPSPPPAGTWRNHVLKISSSLLPWR